MEYIYCGEILDCKEDIAVELLKFSEKYATPGLREFCGEFLIFGLGIENVVSLTNLAEICKAPKLLEAGLAYIKDNSSEIFLNYDMKDLSSSVLYELFKRKFIK